MSENSEATKAAQGMDLFRRACWLHLNHTIVRYLMSNAEGRLDGAEKAMRHIELCTFYVAVTRGIELHDVRGGATEQIYQAVHSHTQALTDNMDELIGFPLVGRPDYDELAPLFFERFHILALEAIDARLVR